MSLLRQQTFWVHHEKTQVDPDTGGEKTTITDEKKYTDGNFQPLTKADVQTLEEGERSRAEWKLFTGAEIPTADSKDNQISAYITPDFEDRTYEVRQKENPKFLIPDNKYICLEVQEP